MGNRTKQRKVQGLTLTLYSRPLHPELFTILAGERVQRKSYDADVWLVNGGHVVRFTSLDEDGLATEHSLTEVMVARPEPITDRGLLQTIPCRGERYHEMDVEGGIKYMISTQEEQLSQTLYDATRHEILSYAQKRELMIADVPASLDLPGSLHVLDVERRAAELLIQSFHLFDESQLVVKTQGIIELTRRRRGIV